MMIIALITLLFSNENWVLAATPPDDPFPLYPCMRPNVDFWKKIYTRYTTKQGVIHDRRNLNIIYEVITLKDWLEPGADKINQEKVDSVKRRYERLLKGLSSGKAPISTEEKRIWAVFADKGAMKLLKDAHLNVRFQLGQKDRFCAGVIRSGAYIDEIRNILGTYDLPEDLAYLPHVESSFDYQAYSKFGAAGIWQFTHCTGRRFMNINYTVDERRDPIRATHAAARLLKENYKALGNWPMAITAYNHGTGGMLKAKKNKGDYETVFKRYNGPSFGFASRNFYSEFLAAREVARNYRTYFGELELAKPVTRHTKELPGNVAIQDLALHFRVNIDTLRELNPALRPPVFTGQKYVPKGYALHLPKKTETATEYLAEKIPDQLLKAHQKPSLFYRVKRGDTAGGIARHHGVRLSDLIHANRLNSKATIYLGQNLRIPVQGEKIVVASQSKVAAMPEKKPAAPAQAPAKPSPEKVLVASAETEGAAKKAELPEIPAPAPTPELQPPVTKPPIPTPEVKPPEIPAPVTAPESMAKADEPEIPMVNPEVVTGNLSVEKVFTFKGKSIGVIEVEPEETLGHYADWLQIPTQQIRHLNGIRYGKPIHVSKKIKIPFGRVTKEQFEEKRYEYHKEIEEDFFAAYRVDKTITYEIEKGDNLWTLCHEKFELPFWMLKKFNPEADFNRLALSNKFVIPVVVKIGETSGPMGLEDDSEKPALGECTENIARPDT